MKYFLLLTILYTSVACSQKTQSDTDYIAHKTEAITIDGIASEETWEQAEWHTLDQRWLGEPYSEEDFSGRFKLAWDEDYLYLMAEIVDDSLVNIYEGTETYWDDDILEIFVDEDRSKGNHQYNHNAFAYHVDIDYNVFDIDTDSSEHFFNDHVDAQFTRNGDTYTWEAAVKIFDDTFEREKENTPVKLNSGKIMGFALAYCDNDTSARRENFIGSEVVEGNDKNRGWIDAGIFGSLKLVE